MHIKPLLSKALPYIISAFGLIMSISIYYLDIVHGNNTFGLFGTSIFITGIYLTIIGAFLIFLPGFIVQIIHVVLQIVRPFKYHIVFLVVFILFSFLVLVYYDNLDSLLVFIQIPILPIITIEAFSHFYLTGITALTCSLSLGIPLTMTIWYYLLLQPLKKVEASIIISSNNPTRSQILSGKYWILLCTVLVITFISRILAYFNSIPGSDTPFYARIAIDFSNTKSISSILARDDFYSIFPISIISFLSGFNPNLVLTTISYYSPLISTLSCLLFMLIARKIFPNRRVSLYIGLFYSLSPILIQSSFDLFKQEFAILLFFGAIAYYLYFFKNSKSRMTRYLNLGIFSFLFLFSMAYYFFLGALAFYFMFFIFTYRKNLRYVLFLMLFSGLVILSIFLAFSYFKGVIFIQSMYNFIYWNLFLKQAAPVFLLDPSFIFWAGPLIVYTPFSLFGFLQSRRTKLIDKAFWWKYLYILLFLLVFLSVMPLFGILPNYFRLMQLTEYPIIFFSAYGLEPFLDFFRERLDKVTKIASAKWIKDARFPRKKLFYSLLITFLTASYLLNFPTYNQGFITKDEKDGFEFLRDNSDFSLFINANLTDAIVLPPRDLLYWTYYYFSFNSTSYPSSQESLLTFPKVNATTGEVQYYRRSNIMMCTEINRMFDTVLYLVISKTHPTDLPYGDLMILLQTDFSITSSIFYQNSGIMIYQLYRM